MARANGQTSPARAYTHDHPPVRNINKEYGERQTLGQRVADRVATAVGSWPFIITQSLFLVAWMALNSYLLIVAHTRPEVLKAWDPYPFILLNLVLSFQAAYTGPVVMMSQNRQAEKDRLAAEHDFEINVKAEKELQVVLDQLVRQEGLLLEALGKLGGPDAEGSHTQTPQDVTLRVLAALERQDATLIQILAALRGGTGRALD